MPVEFCRHLVGKTGQWSYISWTNWFILLEKHDQSSSFNSRRYIVLYPRNGDRIVTIDSVTLLHPSHPFNGPLSGTTQVSRYQKGKTSLDFTEARDSEWQWHQLGHMQICTSLLTDNHASTSPLSFLQAGCPSCRPTNSIKALRHTPYV